MLTEFWLNFAKFANMLLKFALIHIADRAGPSACRLLAPRRRWRAGASARFDMLAMGSRLNGIQCIMVLAEHVEPEFMMNDVWKRRVDSRCDPAVYRDNGEVWSQISSFIKFSLPGRLIFSTISPSNPTIVPRWTCAIVALAIGE